MGGYVSAEADDFAFQLSNTSNAVGRFVDCLQDLVIADALGIEYGYISVVGENTEAESGSSPELRNTSDSFNLYHFALSSCQTSNGTWRELQKSITLYEALELHFKFVSYPDSDPPEEEVKQLRSF